jgi:hypothetical protein
MPAESSPRAAHVVIGKFAAKLANAQSLYIARPILRHLLIEGDGSLGCNTVRRVVNSDISTPERRPDRLETLGSAMRLLRLNAFVRESLRAPSFSTVLDRLSALWASEARCRGFEPRGPLRSTLPNLQQGSRCFPHCRLWLLEPLARDVPDDAALARPPHERDRFGMEGSRRGQHPVPEGIGGSEEQRPDYGPVVAVL